MRRLLLTAILLALTPAWASAQAPTGMAYATSSPALYPAVAFEQGPIGPFSNTNMRSDATGSLSAVPAGPCGTLGPLTNGANVRVRSDSNGALQICGTFGGTPAGADTQVQFNDGGAFGGDAGFTYAKATDFATLAGGLIIGADGSRAAPRIVRGTGGLFFYNSGDGIGVSSQGVTPIAFGKVADMNGANLPNGAMVKWTTGSNDPFDGSADVGITRAAAGILEANSGSAGAGGSFRSSAYIITPAAATGVTVNDAGTLRQQAYAVTVAPAAFVCAATTCDVTIATLPAKARLLSIGADLTQVFACTATCTSSTLSITAGTSAGGTQVLASFDADAATAYFGDADAELGTAMTRAAAIQGGMLNSPSGTTTISIRLTSGTGNIGNGTVTNLSQGSVRFVLVVEIVS